MIYQSYLSVTRCYCEVSVVADDYGHKKFVLDEKRTKSRNLALWTKKRKFTILDEIWTKNGQMIGVISEKSCQILSHSLALP